MEDETPTRQIVVAFSPKILAHDLKDGVTTENAPFVRIELETVVTRADLSDKQRNGSGNAYIEAEMILNDIARYIRKDERFRKDFITAFVSAAQDEIPTQPQQDSESQSQG